MANESKIKIVITGESKDAKKSLDSVEKELKDVGKVGKNVSMSLDKSFKKTSNSIKGFGDSFKGVGKASKLAKAGIAGFIGGIGLSVIKQTVNDVVALGDSIGKTADAFGVSTDFLQEFRFVAERTGVSMQVADSSLGRFTKRLGEAANGTGRAKKVYEQLGVSVQDNNGNFRSQREILLDVADAIDGLGSQAEKAAAVSAIFGREGLKLVNTFEGGSEAFKNLTKDFEDFGGAVSENAVRKAEEIADKLTNAEVAARKFKVEAVIAFADLIPVATNFLQIWIEGVNQIKEFTVGPEINEALTKEERLRRKNNEVIDEGNSLLSNSIGLNSANAGQIESISEKWVRVGKELDLQQMKIQLSTNGLNEQEEQLIKLTETEIEVVNKIKDLQNEIDATTEKYGVIPEVIKEGTRAISGQIQELKAVREEIENINLSGSEAFDTLSLEEYKEHLNEIGGKSKEVKDNIDQIDDVDIDPFRRIKENLGIAAMNADKIDKNLSNAGQKASQFGKALSLDTVGSLALERNLRFAGRGTLPSRNIENAGVAGFGVQSIVPESFQQESRMRALQQVLSQESTLPGSSGFSQEQVQGLRNELQEKFGIGGFGASSSGGDTNINNVYNISATDASSFRQSQSQILNEQNRVLDQASVRNRGLVGRSR